MDLNTIAILGSSATGLSVALACAQAGMSAVICEPDPDARERAAFFAQKDNANLASKVIFADTYDLAETADILFDGLNSEERSTLRLAPNPASVLATPFSTPLPVGTPGQHVRVVPYQPMQLRRLIEMKRFPDTSEVALDTARALVVKIGRVPVVLPTGAQSVGLRLLDLLHHTADHLLLQGAILWELDEAMTTFGFDLGLYEAQDLIGLDVAYARRKAQGMPSLISDRAVQEGRIGKKIGWGWYRYPGGGGAVIDPLIEDLIREEAWFSKTPQRSFSETQIIDQLLKALEREVETILAENQVSTPEDLACILIHGLGFPPEQLPRINVPALNDQRGSSAG